MAYMSQERKKALAPGIKVVLNKYGMKGTIAVRNHSTIVVNIKSGVLDVIGNANEVAVKNGRRVNDRGYEKINGYWYDEHYSGEVLSFVTELLDACNFGNWDKSDYQTDYFNVGWYTEVNIGGWDNYYRLTSKQKPDTIVSG